MVLQPVLVLGSAFLVATMVTGEWMNHKLYALVMVMIPVPLLIFAERIWGKRKDWRARAQGTGRGRLLARLRRLPLGPAHRRLLPHADF